VGDGEKPIITFVGKDKGLVLNKTNATMIVDSYGDESDVWVGKEIELYPDKVNYQGQIVPCLRVRIPQAAPPPPSDGGTVPF
jgi:hypothetical protein